MKYVIHSVPYGGTIENLNENEFELLKQELLIWEYNGKWVYDKDTGQVENFLKSVL